MKSFKKFLEEKDDVWSETGSREKPTPEELKKMLDMLKPSNNNNKGKK